MKDILHFAHGNGFPSPCYHQLINHLNPHFNCCYIERVGHNLNYPVTDNWHYLVQEIIESITKQASKPVVAVGHSLGGILSFLAAIEQPDLFKSVILLDSPLIGRFRSGLIQLFKAIGLIDRITSAHRTRSRRQYWENKQQVWDYLRSKSLFKHFTDACLNDYIDYGLQKNGQNGYSLWFNSEIEYQIYRTIPHILFQYEGKLRVPTYLIYGNKSNVVDSFTVRYMKNKFGIVSDSIEGTHMFPMENPEETARLIRDC